MALAAFGTWRTGDTAAHLDAAVQCAAQRAGERAAPGVDRHLPGVGAFCRAGSRRRWVGARARLGRDLALGVAIGAVMAASLRRSRLGRRTALGRRGLRYQADTVHPARLRPRMAGRGRCAAARRRAGGVALSLLTVGGTGLGALSYLLMWPLALFFGLLHWPQGSWGVIGATLAGLVFSAFSSSPEAFGRRWPHTTSSM